MLLSAGCIDTIWLQEQTINRDDKLEQIYTHWLELYLIFLRLQRPTRPWASFMLSHFCTQSPRTCTSMATFGRSFKPASYLSSLGGRRPAMPGRTMSNSSETSNRSESEDTEGSVYLSGRNTPIPTTKSNLAMGTGAHLYLDQRQPENEQSSRCE